MPEWCNYWGVGDYSKSLVPDLNETVLYGFLALILTMISAPTIHNLGVIGVVLAL